jgi:hypothetical protein
MWIAAAMDFVFHAQERCWTRLCDIREISSYVGGKIFGSFFICAEEKPKLGAGGREGEMRNEKIDWLPSGGGFLCARGREALEGDTRVVCECVLSYRIHDSGSCYQGRN